MATSLIPHRILPLPLGAGSPRQLPAHWRTPILSIPWSSFRNTFRDSLYAIVGGPRAPKQFLGGKYFRDCWVERRIPKRAVAVAAALHFTLVVLPYPRLPTPHRAVLAQPNVELTWSAPPRDLPSVDLSSPTSAAKPALNIRHQSDAPLPPKGADAYHPRQTIFTDSLHPTHPRQTLINSSAPPEPPKILPPLPNIVQLAQATAPDRPRLLINREELAKLRPKRQAVQSVAEVPLPQVPNLEKEVADLNLASQSSKIAKPAMPLNASSAPRIMPRNGQRIAPTESGPVPDLQPSSANAAAAQTFIALSAAPAPPLPQLPLVHGNLSARLSMSPDGKQLGSPSGTAISNTPGANESSAAGIHGLGENGIGGNGTAKTAVSISGGSLINTSPVSGPPGSSGLHTPERVENAGTGTLPDTPSARTASSDTTRKSPAPPSTIVPPGAKPEAILGSKKIYTLHVNMPNLSSATGSWILSFSELREDGSSLATLPGATPLPTADLIGPVPLRKVDPKYPPVLIQEKVEGEVVLYAVIRKDGSVDSIQLVSGPDDQLNTNAMEALSRWKFRPGERAGSPVELEAIVHIPFRISHSRF